MLEISRAGLVPGLVSSWALGCGQADEGGTGVNFPSSANYLCCTPPHLVTGEAVPSPTTARGQVWPIRILPWGWRADT